MSRTRANRKLLIKQNFRFLATVRCPVSVRRYRVRLQNKTDASVRCDLQHDLLARSRTDSALPDLDAV